MDNVKRINNLAYSEFLNWIFDARMIIVFVLIISINNIVINPLIENAKLMEEPLNCFEPFVAVTNSGLVLLIIPVVFLTIIADFPIIDSYSLYGILRIGRRNWAAGQMLKLIYMVISFLAVITLSTIMPILNNCFVGNEWSRVVREFSDEFPKYAQNYGAKLIEENIYFQGDVAATVIKSFLYIAAYLIVLGLILLLFSLINKKMIGFILCGIIISFGTALCAIRSPLMWVFPMANSIVWLHYTKYFRTPEFPEIMSVIYFVALITGLVIAVLFVVQNVSFTNIHHNEEG